MCLLFVFPFGAASSLWTDGQNLKGLLASYKASSAIPCLFHTQSHLASSYPWQTSCHFKTTAPRWPCVKHPETMTKFYKHSYYSDHFLKLLFIYFLKLWPDPDENYSFKFFSLRELQRWKRHWRVFEVFTVFQTKEKMTESCLLTCKDHKCFHHKRKQVPVYYLWAGNWMHTKLRNVKPSAFIM